MPTYLLKSNQVPAIIAPTTPVIGSGIGTGSGFDFTSGMTGASRILNQLTAALKILGMAGTGGNAILGAVGSNLLLTATTGLNVTITPGLALTDRVIEIISRSPAASGTNYYQVQVPSAYTLADNNTSYVWLTNTGALVAATSTTPPTGSRIFLGAVTTASGAITNIDLAGVVGVSGGMFTRVLGDSYSPTDAPPMAVVSKCLYGSYLWNGSAHAQLVVPGTQLPMPFASRTITGNVSLLPTDANIQQFNPGTSSYTINLPDPTKITIGHSLTIQHIGTGGTLTLKSYSGSTTVATLTHGQTVTITAQGTPATPAWPSSATAASMATSAM